MLPRTMLTRSRLDGTGGKPNSCDAHMEKRQGSEATTALYGQLPVFAISEQPPANLRTARTISQGCLLRNSFLLMYMHIALTPANPQKPLTPDEQYEAVSYAWEGQEPSLLLLCDGFVLDITVNADSILRNLRRIHKPKRLWVDAICTYSDRSYIKHLINLRWLFPHFEEPIGISFGAREISRLGIHDRLAFPSIFRGW